MAEIIKKLALNKNPDYATEYKPHIDNDGLSTRNFFIKSKNKGISNWCFIENIY